MRFLHHFRCSCLEDARSFYSLIRKLDPHKCYRFLSAVQATFELSILDRRQNFLKFRSRLVSECDQVVAIDEQRWMHDFRCHGSDLFSREVVGSEISMAGFAIEPVQLQMFVEARHAHESLKR